LLIAGCQTCLTQKLLAAAVERMVEIVGESNDVAQLAASVMMLLHRYCNEGVNSV
jgi:hypothetical protein